MKTALKKLTAFMLAVGMMTTLMTTVHASGYSYTKVTNDYINENLASLDLSKGGYYVENEGEGGYYAGLCAYYGTEPPATGTTPYTDPETGYTRYAWFLYYVYNSSMENYEYSGDYYWDGSKWMRDGGLYSWGERLAATGNNGNNGNNYDNEALLAALANEAKAREAGFATVGAMNAASEKNMSAFEFYNNVIINTPGIEEATPVGQGGKLIINGKESGITATLDKVTPAFVDSVRTQTNGTVLNVVKIGLPMADGIAVITTNFYMPGVVTGDEITVLQYVDGAWVEAAVTEIREDHVVVNLERSGVVAFVRK